jgi:hypothetical protein
MPNDGRMTDEELFNALYIEPETGLFTEAAWGELQEEAPKRWFLAINAGFLVDDAVSDALGQDGANEALWLLGSVLQKHGGQAVCAAHAHQDQFTACHDDRGVLEDLAGGIHDVAAKVAIYLVRSDGTAVIQKGLDFKYATGENYRDADVASLRAGDRGVLVRCPPGTMSVHLAAARTEGFLPLDAAALVHERIRNTTGSDPVPLGDAQSTGWPMGSEEALTAAVSKRAYFATAAVILNAEARRAISNRRAERILEPTSVVKGMSTATWDDGRSTSFVSHANVYDVYEGTRSVGELAYGEQNELIRAVFDKDADFRKLVVRNDVIKAQAEGLWTLVVLLGMGLEDMRVIKSFDQRTQQDIKRIISLLSGTQLGMRVASAFSGDEQAPQVPYDWSELQEEAIETIMSEDAGEPLSVIRPKILDILAPAAVLAPRTARAGPPPPPQSKEVPPDSKTRPWWKAWS